MARVAGEGADPLPGPTRTPDLPRTPGQVLEALRAHGEAPIGTEGMDDGYWVLIDCNDTIVHVFDPEARDKFDLERLWQDAPRVDLGIEGVDPNPAPESTRTDRGDAADPAA